MTYSGGITRRALTVAAQSTTVAPTGTARTLWRPHDTPRAGAAARPITPRRERRVMSTSSNRPLHDGGRRGGLRTGQAGAPLQFMEGRGLQEVCVLAALS